MFILNKFYMSSTSLVTADNDWLGLSRLRDGMPGQFNPHGTVPKSERSSPNRLEQAVQ